MSVVVCIAPAVSSVLLSSPPSLFLLCWARSSLEFDKFYGRPRSDKWRDIVNYGIMERKIILHSRTTPTNWYIYDLQESWELSCYLLVCWLISWTCISWHFKRPWTQHIIYEKWYSVVLGLWSDVFENRWSPEEEAWGLKFPRTTDGAARGVGFHGKCTAIPPQNVKVPIVQVLCLPLRIC